MTFQMNNMRIAGIARELIAAAGDNVLEDYFQFYEGCKWMIETSREILRLVSRLSGNAENYSSMIPEIEENIGYVSQERMPDLHTSDASKEMKRMLKEIKKAYAEWDKEDSGEDKAPLLEDYNESVEKLVQYAESYADACENALRNRYAEDEANVRSLLEAIHDAGELLSGERN